MKRHPQMGENALPKDTALITDMFGAKPLESFLASLADLPYVQTAVREEFGNDAPAIIAKMKANVPLSDEELETYDIIDDLIQNNYEEVDSLEGWSSSSNDIFPIMIMKFEFGSVFWIAAPEFDDIGYFGTLEDAKSAAECDYEPFINEALEHKALEKLEHMPLEDRIAAVAADVDTKRDEYRSIDGHELAVLLGIDDADHPGDDWAFHWFIPRVPTVEIFDRFDGEFIVELLESQLTRERYKELCSNIGLRDAINADHTKVLEFLTDNEKQKIEEGYMEYDKKHGGGDSLYCYAYNSIKVPKRGKDLTFQALLDCGDCIELNTPYDERDGKFADCSGDLEVN